MEPDLNDLNEAAFSGDIEKIKSLLANGAGVNGKSWDGDTPLANAVREGHTEVVELLLTKGTDPNPRGLIGGKGIVAWDIIHRKSSTQIRV